MATQVTRHPLCCARRSEAVASSSSRAQLLQLLDSLPGDSGVSVTLDAREKVWSSGAYSTPDGAGLRRACTLFPASSRAFVQYLRFALPAARFSAVSVCSNVQVPWREDSLNPEGSLNYVAGLTAFEGGQICVRTLQGLVAWQGLSILSCAEFLTPTTSQSPLMLDACIACSPRKDHEWWSWVVLVGDGAGRVLSKSGVSCQGAGHRRVPQRSRVCEGCG